MNTIERIKFHHGNHSPEYLEHDLGMDKGTECEIYNAIQKGASDDELVQITKSVDPDILENN